MISIVFFDLWSRHFSKISAAVYGAELSFSTSNSSSSVTWQKKHVELSYFPVLFKSKFDYQVFQDEGVFIKRSFEALRCSFGVLI